MDSYEWCFKLDGLQLTSSLSLSLPLHPYLQSPDHGLELPEVKMEMTLRLEKDFGSLCLLKLFSVFFFTLLSCSCSRTRDRRAIPCLLVISQETIVSDCRDVSLHANESLNPRTANFAEGIHQIGPSCNARHRFDHSAQCADTALVRFSNPPKTRFDVPEGCCHCLLMQVRPS
jgi:hypothetical protein